MRRRGTHLGLLVGATLALCAAPAAAAATPFEVPLRPSESVPTQLRALVGERIAPDNTTNLSFHPALSLTTANGYRIGVIGMGQALVVGVTRKGGRSMTAYVARGTVTPRRLQASFGRYGRLAMRFRPSPNRTWQKPRRRCRGAGRFIDRRGVFVGSFRFRGEDSYVSVQAHRVPGQVSSVAPQCAKSGSSHRGQRASRSPRSELRLPEPTFLVAAWREGVSAASFGAIEWFGKTLFFASVERSEGGVAILRIAFEAASARAFDLDDALTFARVSPPAPFKGNGTYRAAPDGTTTWTGALAVNFPGAPRFPLTGPPFEPLLSAGFPGEEPLLFAP
ncbi:MAG TPA: hypothetical protein VFI03_10550 [Solirubrobacterales bacterium]|nr:hypothetical protein [Solirubrobacterales bacterium]